MLTKVNDVIFQYLWRYSCQFKPQKFSIDFFDVHLCPPLWKRFRHLCSRHHWRMPLHPCTISSLQHWISCSCLFHMHWVNIQDDRWQVHSRAPPLLRHCLRATTAMRAGCVQRGFGRETLVQGAAAEMLPKMTHDPTHHSWTPRGSLQTRSALLSS